MDWPICDIPMRDIIEVSKRVPIRDTTCATKPTHTRQNLLILDKTYVTTTYIRDITREMTVQFFSIAEAVSSNF